MYIFLHLYGIAVDMERCRFLALEGHFPCAQSVHEMAVVNAAGEQP